MKGNIAFIFCMQVLLFDFILYAHGQEEEVRYKMLRIYEDNDFINIRGKGTDKAYSGGTRFDLYYEQKKRPVLFPGFMGLKNDSISYGGGWGIMQTIFTPNNISDPYFEQNDYFYSGALFLMHSLSSFSRVYKYGFQVSFLLGIRGPAALGKQTQTMVHRAIHYTLPLGWDNQLRNSPLFNLDVGFEKEIAVARFIEVIAGGKSYLGTFRSGLSVYPLFRVGFMHPYFNGFIKRFSAVNAPNGRNYKKLQAYIILKPQVQWVLNNALIQTGLFATKPTIKADDRLSASAIDQKFNYNDCSIRHWVFSADYGAVVSFGKFAVSFTQNVSSELRKGTYSHEVGNISLYFAL